MVNLLRFPKGYLIKAKDSSFGTGRSLYPDGVTISDVGGDKVVDALYHIYLAKQTNWQSWDFKKSVIKRATGLYGDFFFWLRMQYAENDSCHGFNLEFLDDTLQYIRTGHRRMAIVTWAEIIQEYPQPELNVATINRFKSVGASQAEFADVMSKWLSWPDGFDDMLSTTNLLFGAPRTKVDNKL